MIWTHASGRPVADEEENALSNAKWNQAGGSLSLLSWSENTKGLFGGDLLHVFNHGTWRRKMDKYKIGFMNADS